MYLESLAPMTQAEHIVTLFDFLWHSDRFHIRKDIRGEDRVTFKILSQDRMTTFASIIVAPRMSFNPGPGKFAIEINYPAFNGSLEEMQDSLNVIKDVAEVVQHMLKTAIISQVNP